MKLTVDPHQTRPHLILLKNKMGKFEKGKKRKVITSIVNNSSQLRYLHLNPPKTLPLTTKPPRKTQALPPDPPPHATWKGRKSMQLRRRSTDTNRGNDLNFAALVVKSQDNHRTHPQGGKRRDSATPRARRRLSETGSGGDCPGDRTFLLRCSPMRARWSPTNNNGECGWRRETWWSRSMCT